MQSVKGSGWIGYSTDALFYEQQPVPAGLNPAPAGLKRTVAAEHFYALPEDRFGSNLGHSAYFMQFPSKSQETGSAVGAPRYHKAFGLASGYLDLDAHVLSFTCNMKTV